MAKLDTFIAVKRASLRKNTRLAVGCVALGLVFVSLFQIAISSNAENYTVEQHSVPANNRLSNLFTSAKGVNSNKRVYDYEDAGVFASQVMQLMEDFKPNQNCGKLHSPECTLETLRIDPDYEGPIYSKEHLRKCLQVNYNVFEDLKTKHSAFLEALPEKFPESMYQGRGIVMLAEGRYTALSYLVLRIMRERGVTLPVEIFMPPGVEEKMYCEDVLPKYNAKCIHLDRLLDLETINKMNIKGYQLKSLAFLVSSFNEMLYIDSDSYPLHDVNQIFETEPYTTYGMILWPDFWRRATSPAFYGIAGLELGRQVRFGVDTVTNPAIFQKMSLDLDKEVSLHDRENSLPDGTTDSSVIVMNKNTHVKTMLLSMYYNIYGPENYYSLLSQDTFGEGDKETFCAAAEVTGEKYWQVKTRSQPGGDLLHNGKRPRSTTMLQYNPIKDYEIYKELSAVLGNLKQNSYDKMRVPRLFNSGNQQVYFAHYNLGKLDPLIMTGWDRRYGFDLTDFGFDFELRNVELMLEMFCSETEKIRFDYVKNPAEAERACEESHHLFQRMSRTKDKVIIDKADLHN